jgi:CDP-6-deoxy-D-xylo-4-hexulose-3-dehydrase
MDKFWPLMKDIITEDDKTKMIDFIKSTNRFTNGVKCKEFEKAWSSWLGCKHSLFTSSGSTANYLLISAMKDLYGLKPGDKVIVPSMTWVTNIGPIIQLGLEPIFCDVNTFDFSFDSDSLAKIRKDHNDIKMIWITHLFGITADIDSYKKLFPEALIAEDVCESHGCEIDGRKCGAEGEGGTFSFYFGHHMTTVEGGMVSTNNTELYELMRAKRSHGLSREMSQEHQNKYKREYPDVHPQFLFITDGYNFRNMEINAVLGLNQLKQLDSSIVDRKLNFSRFLKLLSRYPKHFNIDFKVDGNSSFVLPFICINKSLKVELEEYLASNGMETRPLCSGNLLRQPFLKYLNLDPRTFEHSEKMHFNGFYVGNNHLITEEEWVEFELLLTKFMFPRHLMPITPERS